MSVVYPFYNRHDNSLESLNLSIASVQQNHRHTNIVVIGDPTPHYTIPSPRKKGPFGKWVDSIAKLQLAIDSSEVTEDFLYMYDDTFFLTPAPIRDYYLPTFEDGGSTTWNQVRNSTLRQLRTLTSIEPLNFSTHFPILFNKPKLQQAIDLFNHPFLIELVYLNLWGKPVPIDDSFLFTRSLTPFIPDNVSVLNVKTLTPHTEALIRERLLMCQPELA